LNYEYEHYAEMRKGLPKKNKKVNTPMGIGKVVEVLTLKGAVLVDIPESGVKEFDREEISLVEPSQLPDEKKGKPKQQGRRRRSR
jgi:cell fate regulator YaaT (PSP1 superfamily)